MDITGDDKRQVLTRYKAWRSRTARGPARCLTVIMDGYADNIMTDLADGYPVNRRWLARWAAARDYLRQAEARGGYWTRP